MKRKTLSFAGHVGLPCLNSPLSGGGVGGSCRSFPQVHGGEGGGGRTSSISIPLPPYVTLFDLPSLPVFFPPDMAAFLAVM